MPGLFDPLTATQARRLNALRGSGCKLAVIVLEGERTLLPAEARAALVAGLRAVSLVLIANSQEWRTVLPASQHIRVIEDAEGEAARSAEFIKFVIARQNGAPRQ